MATIRVVLLVSCAFVCGSCAIFSGKPPLPKRGAIETADGLRAPDEFEAVVARADIIYFATERLDFSSTSTPVWKLIEALRRSGLPAALGWDSIDGDGQELLDQWQEKQIATDYLMARLRFVGSVREREQCRDFLRDSRAHAFRHLALHCPGELLARIRAGEALTAADKDKLARGFHVPKGDAENFAEQFSSSRELNDQERSALHRAYLASEQFAAERIVRHLQERGGKLLVFLHRRYLETVHGVPGFVAQKINVRQVVLDSPRPRRTRPDLVIFDGARTVGWQFQVVNRAPLPRGHQTRLLFPR